MNYPKEFNPQSHATIQSAPIIGAGAGGVAGTSLGTLFALLTGANPMLGMGIGGAAGLVGGGLMGSKLKNTYNANMTPEEAAYLKSLGANI